MNVLVNLKIEKSHGNFDLTLIITPKAVVILDFVVVDLMEGIDVLKEAVLKIIPVFDIFVDTLQEIEKIFLEINLNLIGKILNINGMFILYISEENMDEHKDICSEGISISGPGILRVLVDVLVPSVNLGNLVKVEVNKNFLKIKTVKVNIIGNKVDLINGLVNPLVKNYSKNFG